MFSGIIEATGVVRQVAGRASARRLTVAVGVVGRGARVGESIAVNGVCLTVASSRAGVLAFDVVAETLRCTTLGEVATGDRVNLERSLKVGDRVSGHFVVGHVDGVGTIAQRRSARGDVRLTIRLPEQVDPRAVVPKGSIAVDGVSLTVGEVSATECTVYLIPETLKRTVLGSRKVGERVNLEIDLISRYVCSWLSKRSGASRITEAFLRKHGFA